MVTIKDVAREAGVTQAVVSRLLNRDPTLQVRPATRERVLATAERLDYTPNHAARALRAARVGTIGLAVHEVSNPVHGAIIEGAQRAVSTYRCVLLLADVDELHRDRGTFGRVVGSNAIDGLILLPAGNQSDRKVAHAAVQQGVPTVLVNERSRTYPCVSLDDRGAARLATQHLIELGHRRIGVLYLDGQTARTRERRKGHQEALTAAGIDPPDRWWAQGGHTLDAGYRGMNELLDAGEPPSALVAHSVLAAAGAMTAARERGIAIPEELSLVGFHDVSFAEHLDPPLTVVRLGLSEMGRVAVETLMRLIEGGEDLPRVHLGEPEPALIVRRTTTPPAGSRAR